MDPISVASLREKMSSIGEFHFLPFVHSSKLNGFANSLSESLKYLDEGNLSANIDNRTQSVIISDLIKVFDNFCEMLKQSTKENFTSYLSSSLRAPKAEIRNLRDLCSEKFKLLGYEEVSNLFAISENDLNNQDLVDMKRMNFILNALKEQFPKNKNVIARLSSLKDVNISVEIDNSSEFHIPFIHKLPNIVVKKEDVSITKEIGRGQTGLVYKGVYNNRVVAVKKLTKPVLTPNEMLVFNREVHALITLDHPCLIKCYGFTNESPYYILTEYMENGSVFKCLSYLTPTQKSVIANDVAAGVAYLHSKYVIHRDLKSLNILLDKDYRARICDFGLSKSTIQKGPLTGLVGTTHWMAPEIIRSSPNYGDSVDVYSFGIFLWELLKGQVPYANKSPDQIANDVLRGIRPPLPDGPPKLIELIKQCWDGDPAKRPKMCKVNELLKNPEYHFQGTDEIKFKEIFSSKHNKSLSFQVNPDSPRNILKRLYSCTGQDSVNFHKVIAPALLQRGEYWREYLDLLLQNERINFDVEILKALLTFSDESDEQIRTKALLVLLRACQVCFSLIKTSPSFLISLLKFIRKPLDYLHLKNLFRYVFEILKDLQEPPPDIVNILIWAIKTYEKSASSILQCLAKAMKFDECKEDLTKEHFLFLLSYDQSVSPVLDAFILPGNSYPNDLWFVEALLETYLKPISMQYLTTIVESRRFSLHVANTIMKCECDFEDVMQIYKVLFNLGGIPEKMSVFPKFYEIAEKLIGGDEKKMALDAVYKGFNFDLFRESNLPRVISELFVDISSVNTDLLDVIMAGLFVVYKALEQDSIQEFTDQVERLKSYLFSQFESIRKPSFLCIIKAAQYIEDFDYSFLLPVAAFFVHSKNEITANTASIILKDHIEDKHVDIGNTIEIFVNNFRESSESVKVALNAFAELARSGVEVDSSLLKELSKIYQVVSMSN